MMSTEQLIEILKVRKDCDVNQNPTSQSLLYELILALERLKNYEDAEAAEAAELKKALARYFSNPHSIE